MFADRPDIKAAIIRHAAEEFPREACGLIVRGEYVRCTNVADKPEDTFKIDPDQWAAHYTAGMVQAVVHSHPDGPGCPTRSDMLGQRETAVPWVICDYAPGRTADVFEWGDQLPIAPLEGRVFRAGVHDCFALVRDWYRLNRGVILPDIPRDDGWWEKGENVLLDNFRKVGFVMLPPRSPILIGDGFMGAIMSSVPNHCGVYVGEGALLHHLTGRYSRKETFNPWRRYVSMHVRLA